MVLLHGQISTVPKIFANNEGELIKGTFSITVLRRPMTGGQILSDKLFYDCPVILTRNEKMIQMCSQLQQGDMVDIRGALSTREVIKTTICPECSAKNSTNGVITYVTPIYICRRETGLSTDEGIVLLRERNEISNLILIIGTLCREPETYLNEKNKAFAQYQIASNRKYRIREDPPEKKTDYPWIKTNGEQALKDSENLHVGSQIYVNGALQTREVKRISVCSSCSHEYEWNDTATEIVPYSIEYFSDCEKMEGETENEQNQS